MCGGFPSPSGLGAYIRTLTCAGEGVSSVRHAAKQLWRWWGGEKGGEERGGVVWGKKFRFLRGFIFCLAQFFAILLIGYEIA